ncbi:MAG: enamine deaminase RidA (YjgF/YER057c/UK114 family) [Myxococcota bacterium]|jgi:enamine deaminase RidA (YjgF/YER057c/UK114 family)
MVEEHRKHVHSGSPFELRYGFSRAIRVGDRVIVAGTAPIEPDGGCAETVEDQTLRCYEIIAESLQKVGASAKDVVRTRMYLVHPADADAVGRVHRDFFGHTRPAATMVVVGNLIDPRWRVEVEAEAIVDSGGSAA